MAMLQRLKLRDLGSLHGTYINDSDQRLNKDNPVEIKEGDNIRFGVDIMRKMTFSPTVVKIDFDYIDVPNAKPEQDSTRWVSQALLIVGNANRE